VASSTPVLVTGGAGYVGAHTCLALAEAGFSPIVYDSLARGWAEFVQWGPLEKGDIRDRERLRQVIEKHRPAAVLHFAALIEVGESVKDPGGFFDNNVAGALTLIDEAQKAGVKGLVFSSTCATYGEPKTLPLDETHPQNPLSPYGRSKLMIEQALAEFDQWLGFRSVSLRYFNAAGADPKGRIGEKHEPETHAIPNAIYAARDGKPFKLFGTDYPTRDGTCVRDYVHVLDLADAHVRALNHLLGGGKSEVFNLGTGVGTTVRELIAAIEAAGGKTIPVIEEPRRPGDAPVLVADNTKAREGLGWAPQRSLAEIVDSAWRWHVG
jgi:UDP-glucose 4-epimerase